MGVAFPEQDSITFSHAPHIPASLFPTQIFINKLSDSAFWRIQQEYSEEAQGRLLKKG